MKKNTKRTRHETPGVMSKKEQDLYVDTFTTNIHHQSGWTNQGHCQNKTSHTIRKLHASLARLLTSHTPSQEQHPSGQERSRRKPTETKSQSSKQMHHI